MTWNRGLTRTITPLIEPSHFVWRFGLRDWYSSDGPVGAWEALRHGANRSPVQVHLHGRAALRDAHGNAQSAGRTGGSFRVIYSPQTLPSRLKGKTDFYDPKAAVFFWIEIQGMAFTSKGMAFTSKGMAFTSKGMAFTSKGMAFTSKNGQIVGPIPSTHFYRRLFRRGLSSLPFKIQKIIRYSIAFFLAFSNWFSTNVDHLNERHYGFWHIMDFVEEIFQFSSPKPIRTRKTYQIFLSNQSINQSWSWVVLFLIDWKNRCWKGDFGCVFVAVHGTRLSQPLRHVRPHRVHVLDSLCRVQCGESRQRHLSHHPARRNSSVLSPPRLPELIKFFEKFQVIIIFVKRFCFLLRTIFLHRTWTCRGINLNFWKKIFFLLIYFLFLEKKHFSSLSFLTFWKKLFFFFFFWKKNHFPSHIFFRFWKNHFSSFSFFYFWKKKPFFFSLFLFLYENWFFSFSSELFFFKNLLYFSFVFLTNCWV